MSASGPEGAAKVSGTNPNMIVESGARAATGLFVGLPILAAGMACVWFAGGSGPIPGPLLALLALALILGAFLINALATAWVPGVRYSRKSVLVTVGRAVLVGLVATLAATSLNFVEALHPEAISPFDRSFENGHLVFSAAVSLIAVALYALRVVLTGLDQRVKRIGIALLVAAVGTAAWYGSSVLAYDAVRGSYTDSIILMLHTMAVAALVLASVANGALAARASR
jgi:hypothetical protein